jgi:hypothetical protein
MEAEKQGKDERIIVVAVLGSTKGWTGEARESEPWRVE